MPADNLTDSDPVPASAGATASDRGGSGQEIAGGMSRITGNTERWFTSLPGNVRGAIWMLIAGLGFTAMGSTVKLLGNGVIGGPALDSFQIAFFRCLFGLLALMPWIIQGGGFAVFKTDRLGLQLIRAIVGVGAMTSFFYALARAPLADVTAISFAKPLFVVLLAVFFLSEKVRWRRWTATAVGFLGVVIMLRPGQDGFDPVLLVALMGSFLVACAVIFVKKMTKTETTLTMLAYFGIISSLVTLIPALLVWRDPTLTQWGMLLVIGSLGVLSQSFIIRAFRCGEASAVAPFDYTRLIFAAVFGFFLFAEIPDIWTLGGASIIVAATFYIARREASLGKPAKGPAEAITRKV